MLDHLNVMYAPEMLAELKGRLTEKYKLDILNEAIEYCVKRKEV